MSILVEFKGTRYWLIADNFEDGGPLAPLDHCDEKGDVNYFLLESFAHVYVKQKPWQLDGVFRYHEKIGDSSDLKVVKP